MMVLSDVFTCKECGKEVPKRDTAKICNDCFAKKWLMGFD